MMGTVTGRLIQTMIELKSQVVRSPKTAVRKSWKLLKALLKITMIGKPILTSDFYFIKMFTTASW